jgi:hypothetical protein
LKEHLNQEGILIIDGPLEANSNLAFFIRRMANECKRLIGKGKAKSYAPYHISFSNSKNQAAFFQAMGLKVMRYKVYEEPWPYPGNWNRSLFNNVKVVIARVSKKLSLLSKSAGNRFIYVGHQ